MNDKTRSENTKADQKVEAGKKKKKIETERLYLVSPKALKEDAIKVSDFYAVSLGEWIKDQMKKSLAHERAVHPEIFEDPAESQETAIQKTDPKGERKKRKDKVEMERLYLVGPKHLKEDAVKVSDFYSIPLGEWIKGCMKKAIDNERVAHPEIFEETSDIS